ncbi:MAG: porin family protein [Crenarchaeota archaeon]|nr:porin family protein [Thermoproteota archaeon]OQA91813.1 MAG: hypothetical protein BWY27_00490 [Bacteroidetes bacterium ADurb.Bin234]
MKKLFLISTVIFFGLFNAKAQIQSNLGLRLGGNTEISYQYGFGDANWVEGSIGLGFDKQKDSAFSTSINFNCLYLYSYNFSGSWFVYGGLGTGVEISFKDIKDYRNLKDSYERAKRRSEILYLKVAPIVGVEYQMDAPVSFFAEYRPEMLIILKPKVGFQLYGFSVGVRYRFE